MLVPNLIVINCPKPTSGLNALTSSEHRVITTQVQNDIAEASSFKTTHT
jgi:hypothetical protein